MTNSQTDFQKEIAELAVESLKLDMPASDITPDMPFFDDAGLGLDSIDVLELAFAISKKYGVSIKSGDSENVKIFQNLASLSAFIEENKTA